MIIATDGLWDVTTEAEAVQIVHTALDSNAELKVRTFCMRPTRPLFLQAGPACRQQRCAAFPFTKHAAVHVQLPVHRRSSVRDICQVRWCQVVGIEGGMLHAHSKASRVVLSALLLRNASAGRMPKAGPPVYFASLSATCTCQT